MLDQGQVVDLDLMEWSYDKLEISNDGCEPYVVIGDGFEFAHFIRLAAVKS